HVASHLTSQPLRKVLPDRKSAWPPQTFSRWDQRYRRERARSWKPDGVAAARCGGKHPGLTKRPESCYEEDGIKIVLLKQINGRGSGAGGDHPQTSGSQNLAFKIEQSVFIVNQQHGAFQARFAAGKNAVTLSQWFLTHRHRQPDFQHGAARRVIVRGDL